MPRLVDFREKIAEKKLNVLKTKIIGENQLLVLEIQKQK